MCLKETFSGLLVAWWSGYNGEYVALAETEEIVLKPCQALSSSIFN